jgi:hypothetical protein
MVRQIFKYILSNTKAYTYEGFSRKRMAVAWRVMDVLIWREEIRLEWLNVENVDSLTTSYLKTSVSVTRRLC